MISVVHPFSYVDQLKQIDEVKRMGFPALNSSLGPLETSAVIII